MNALSSKLLAGSASVAAGSASVAAATGVVIVKASRQAAEWAAGNPGSAACVAAGSVGLVAVAAPGVISSAVLAAAGFGPDGIVGASIASGIHTGIGNVAAGSTFATLQSAGAAGYGAAAVNGVVQVAGGGLTAVAAVIKSKL